MNKILFDASSTSPISDLIAVAPGDCVLINAWGLSVNEVAQVYRTLVALGNIPEQQSGSCLPSPQVVSAQITAEVPYFPCNSPVEVGQAPDQNITSIVIQQPGFYRVHLTPSALGVAVVEAVVLTGAEACEQAASQCCCKPEVWWEGTSLNPCLTITPGGDAGHRPVFDLDVCCLFQNLPPNANPTLADELIFMQGGACFRATIDQIFSTAIVCESLGEQPLLPPLAGDQIVALDAGASCKRVDGETFVEFFETPWTGISVNPNLTIAPGGINGHGPTFDYDLCADLQAIPACTCEPQPGDEIVIIQGGACVRATWPVVNVCDQIGLLPMGALIAGDTTIVREAGGACKQVLIDDLLTCAAISNLFSPGVPGPNDTVLIHDPVAVTCFTLTYAQLGTALFPLLAPDGSCAAPSYSFASSPDSGMWYDAGTGEVVISDDNCVDEIRVGASISITASVSSVSVQSGPASFVQINGGGVFVNSSAGQPIALASGSSVGITSSAGFNISSIVGAGGAFIASANGSTISIGAAGPISLATAGLTLAVTVAGELTLAGNPGVAAQVLTSNGPGVPPTWQAAGGGGNPPLNLVQNATGNATRNHAAFNVAWEWTGLAVNTGGLSFNETVAGTNSGASLIRSGIPSNSRTQTMLVRHGGVDVFRVGGKDGAITTLLKAPDGNVTNNNGTGLDLFAGDASGTGSGGQVNIRAGTNNAGLGFANVAIFGGAGVVVNVPGGDVNLTAGNTLAGSTITSGNVNISPGSRGGVQAYAGSTIIAQFAGGPAMLALRGRPDATSYWQSAAGQTADPAAPNSQPILIATHVTVGAGGLTGGVYITSGRSLSPVLPGSITPESVQFDNGANGFGQTCDIVAGAQTAGILAAADRGFFWLPAMNTGVPPTGVPNKIASFLGARPSVVEDDGATITLWIYSRVSAAWRSVVLA